MRSPAYILESLIIIGSKFLDLFYILNNDASKICTSIEVLSIQYSVYSCNKMFPHRNGTTFLFTYLFIIK
jgi:hypothetical protein